MAQKAGSRAEPWKVIIQKPTKSNSVDGLSKKVHFVLATKQGLYQTGKPICEPMRTYEVPTTCYRLGLRVITSASMTTPMFMPIRTRTRERASGASQACF